MYLGFSPTDNPTSAKLKAMFDSSMAKFKLSADSQGILEQYSVSDWTKEKIIDDH